MKTQLILVLLLTAVVISTKAQKTSDDKVVDIQKHQIVMQVTQGDSLFQQAVVGQIKNIKTALPNAEIEVVCHSRGLPMLVAAETVVAEEIVSLSKQNVTFAACENTMRHHKVKKEDLIKQAITVPSGQVEIVLKQEAGWTYVRGGF